MTAAEHTASTNALAVGDVGAGHLLGRYELLMPIASGGMAMVWAARLKGTRGFQKLVAVKTILPKLSEDASFEQMFLDEASLASRVRHPHVVEILDLGEQDGVLFLVMEWIDGIPLNQLMKAAKKAGGVPLPVAVRIAMQACAGLHAAHELRDDKGQLVGLVHRDVSPQNILVTNGGVTKVVDFGVAKATALGDGATGAGKIKGKVGYIAPEQVKGGTIDRRVDVFAMGIVLYALATSKHPFRMESEAATMYRICSPEPAVPPHKFLPGFPLPLERVIMQALSKDPAKRFPTANDFLRALDQALPRTMRASTDEDMAAFVRSLFAEQLDQRSQSLQKAIETAEQRATQRTSLRELLDTNPHPPSSRSPQSLSGSDVLNLATTRTENISVSGVNTLPVFGDAPNSATGDLTAPIAQRPRKSRAGVMFLLAMLACAIAAGGYFYLKRTRPVASTPPAPLTEPIAPQPEPKQPEPSAAKETVPAATNETAGSEPVTEPEPSTLPSQRPRVSRSGKSSQPAPTSSKAAPTTKPKSSWQHDPGF